MSTDVIAARRQHIQDNAPCVGCGAPLAACKAARGKDPTAPEWFGCCARGTAMAPCQHTVDAAALMALVKEIESGSVRTVEEVVADSQRQRVGTAMFWCDYLTQGQVWYPAGKRPVAIAAMDPEWRYNSARLLERRAATIAAKYQSSRDLRLAALTASSVGPSDTAADSLERTAEEEDADIERAPAVWIRDTALYLALVADLPTEPAEMEALAERARHLATCPARAGAEDCRCEQIRAEREAAYDTTPEWTLG
ncbi:hypothetical protein ACGFIY_21115 [Micromonospora chersina]|uniref:hypothetical protein n=1 Tax=Micromonospora chersina TaxID=47854 RepID=UPI003723E0EF